jgi:tetratricopeptide (TPR) repeat protein
LDKAITDFNAALKINPDDVETLCSRGCAYGHKGDSKKAIDDFNAAIKIEPDLAKVRAVDVIAYHKKGDYDRSIADYTPRSRLTWMMKTLKQLWKGCGKSGTNNDEKGDL